MSELKFWKTDIGKKMMHGLHDHSSGLCSIRTTISLLKLRMKKGEIEETENMINSINSFDAAATKCRDSIDYIYESVKQHEMENEMIKELQEDITPELEEKYEDRFNRQARYMGNGIYSIAGLYSTDTRELFLMFIHQQEFARQFE